MLGFLDRLEGASKADRVGGGDLSEIRTIFWRKLGLEFIVERLKNDPLIATHALRIRSYYDGAEIVHDLREERLSLISSIDREISQFG